MKKIVIGILSMAAFAGSSSFAGTMGPVAEAPNWAGFYLGGDVGYTWFESKLSEPFSPFVPSFTIHSTKTSSDFLEGLHAGYNWQSGNLVYGLELGIDATQVNQTHRCVTPDANSGISSPLNCIAFNEQDYSTEVPWEASVLARLGWVWNDTALIYATGGFSFADIKNTYRTHNTITVPGPLFLPDGAQSFEDTRTGGTIGAGLEYKFNPNWIGRVEYRYSGYGSKTYNPVNAGGFWSPFSVKTAVTENTVRLGLSYLF